MEHNFIIIFIGAHKEKNFLRATGYITFFSKVGTLKTDTIHRVATKEEFENETLERILELRDNVTVFFVHDNERTVKVCDIETGTPGYVDYDELGKIRKFINEKINESKKYEEYKIITNPSTGKTYKFKVKRAEKCECKYVIGIDLSDLEYENRFIEGIIDEDALSRAILPTINLIKRLLNNGTLEPDKFPPINFSKRFNDNQFFDD